jgi:two-component system response regulator HydG
MIQQKSILIVDDDEFIRLSLKMLLDQHYAHVDVLSDPKRLVHYLKNSAFDVVLLDMNFRSGDSSGNEGLYWLEEIKKTSPATGVVLITAYSDVQNAVEAIKKGAIDFVVKPWQNEKLIATLSSAISVTSERKKVDNLQKRQRTLIKAQPIASVIGESLPMQRVYKIVEKVSATDANVLILGANGTGKELIAKSLHAKSYRKNNPFISVDIGALPESLFESELFGHKKGAFTDAKTDRMGLFEAADGGTIFLDEIGNLSLKAQSKLLTVLQKRQLTRLGTTTPIDIDIRLISATNVNLAKMVSAGEFREDLLYRINTVEVQIPELNKRLEDIKPLALHFLELYSTKYAKSDLALDSDALKWLERYQWPGNVRELQHAIERAVIMSENKTLTGEDFEFLTSSGKRVNPLENFNLENLEKWAVEHAIDKHKGNISHAATELGLSRGALYRRMDKYGL